MTAFEHIDRLDEQFFNSLRDKYVPACGKADTVAGEIIRAMDRIIYRYWNDGDMVFHGYGNETCNSSFRYLARTIGEHCPEFNCTSEHDYEWVLARLASGVASFLEDEENKWVFTTTNEDDSRTASDDDLEAACEEWEEEEEW